MKTLRLLVGTLVGLLMLASCGGGVGAGSPTASGNLGEPTARIQVSPTAGIGATVVLDGSTSSDPQASSLVHDWKLVSVPTGSATTLSNASAVKPTVVPDLPGAYVVSLAVRNPQVSSPVVTATFTVGSPSIVLDQTEPVTGATKLSLSGDATGAVSWFVDLASLGSGAAEAGKPIVWDTTSVGNGSHLLIARVQTGPSTYQEVRRTVSVSNSKIVLSASVSGSTGTVSILVNATSPYGITSVSGQFDGASPVVLTSPNACASSCPSGPLTQYRFTVNADAVGSGSHTLTVTAVDGNPDTKGNTKVLLVPVVISNAPIVNLTKPVDGAIVFGALTYEGTSTTDKGGGVTVSAKLDDLPIPTTGSGSFSGTFDLTGVPVGAHVLTVTARDVNGLATTVQRTINVSSSASMVYAPATTLPSGSQVLAVEDPAMLYQLPDGRVFKRDLLTGVDVAIQQAESMLYTRDWQIHQGQVIAFGQGDDCGANFVCVYRWSATGSRQNLTTLNPWAAGSYQQHPVARGGYVMWCNDGGSGGSYTLYNLASSTYSHIPMPAGVNYLGNWNYELAVVGGVVQAYFWGQTGGSGTSSAFEVYKWTSSGGAPSAVTSLGLRSIYTQTDGQRAAWQQTPVGGASDSTFSLVTQPVSGGAFTTASTSATGFLLRDGVLAWAEGSGASAVIKASTSSSTSTLSVAGSGALQAVGNGKVIYTHLRKTYSWDASGNVSTLRADFPVSNPFVSNGWFIFTSGQSVYRVPL